MLAPSRAVHVTAVSCLTEFTAREKVTPCHFARWDSLEILRARGLWSRCATLIAQGNGAFPFDTDLVSQACVSEQPCLYGDCLISPFFLVFSRHTVGENLEARVR